jgi:hypothetical protein
MGKQAKNSKPSKVERQQRKERNAYPLAGSSLLAQSERYIKEVPNARPFEDMAYFVGAFMVFFIWRLSAAVKSQSQGKKDISNTSPSCSASLQERERENQVAQHLDMSLLLLLHRLN